MRGLLLIFTVTVVLGSAVWAYRQNYQTRAVLDEVAMVEREIAVLEARRAVLESEWAYLNRPDRLRRLSELAFSKLELGPFLPEQFARISDLPFPEAAESGLLRLAERAP